MFDAEGRVSVSEDETAAGREAWIVKFAAINDLLDIGSIEAAYAAMAFGRRPGHGPLSPTAVKDG